MVHSLLPDNAYTAQDASSAADTKRVLCTSVQFLPWNPPQDPCVRYRCEHLTEQLYLQGLQATLGWSQNHEPFSLDADILVLNRAPYDARIQQISDAARASGAALVYGADDLMVTDDLPRKGILHFDYGEDAQSQTDQAATSEWDSMRTLVQMQRKTLALCDCAVVSTEYLAQRVREQGTPAYVIRNAMSQEMEMLSKNVRRDRSLTGGRVVLGYLSGGSTHRHDFGEIAEVVSALMRRHTHVYLMIVGPMKLPESLCGFGTRLRRLPFVPWQDLPGLLGEIDINLAPLDMLQPFNHAKSEIKWMEAGAVGVPTIASASRGFQEAVQHGNTGILANTQDEWAQALEELVTQPDFRTRLGEAARQQVYSEYTAAARSVETAATFAEICERYVQRVATPAAILPPVVEPSPSLPLRFGRLTGRTLIQLQRNWQRALSPFYWQRVMDRWERKNSL